MELATHATLVSSLVFCDRVFSRHQVNLCLFPLQLRQMHSSASPLMVTFIVGAETHHHVVFFFNTVKFYLFNKEDLAQSVFHCLSLSPFCLDFLMMRCTTHLRGQPLRLSLPYEKPLLSPDYLSPTLWILQIIISTSALAARTSSVL